MWCWTFYADDPLNSKVGDEMGVVISTSHHEPMARNHQEWSRHRKEYGAWNYVTNQKIIDQFFSEGIRRMKDTEDVVTIGMRGDGDGPMSEDADTKLLERTPGINVRLLPAKPVAPPRKPRRCGRSIKKCKTTMTKACVCR